jgi:hypothetical protein
MRTATVLSGLAAVATAQLPVDTFPDCKKGPLASNNVCNMSLGKSNLQALYPPNVVKEGRSG